MKFTEKHVELVGLHFGDGSLTKRKGTNQIRFQLRGDAISDREHYNNFIIPLCNELIGFSLIKREVGTVYDKNGNCFGVSIESPLLQDFFEKLGVKIGRKEELSVPNWIKENKNFSKAFVRGLFDTDGTISYKKNNTSKSKFHTVGVVSIVSTSRVLITKTAFILSNLKLKHYVRVHKKSNGEKDAHRVDIFKPHINMFMEVIGSHNPKHLSKFEIESKFGFCPPYTTFLQRKQILKGELNPFSLYAGVP